MAARTRVVNKLRICHLLYKCFRVGVPHSSVGVVFEGFLSPGGGWGRGIQKQEGGEALSSIVVYEYRSSGGGHVRGQDGSEGRAAMWASLVVWMHLAWVGGGGVERKAEDGEAASEG
jgi:hypothetical protein